MKFAGSQSTGPAALVASNATYTSGSITVTGVGGGVTVASNTGQRIDISVAAPVAQSVQTQGLMSLAASNTTYSSGLAVLTGSNMVTVRSSGAGQTIIIDASQSVQVVQSALAASNTTYTSGVVTITGVGGGVTVSSNTGQRIDISVAAQSVQVVQSAIAASNTTYTSGAVTITGVGGGVTVSSNTGQRIDISVVAPVAQTAQTGLSGVAASNTTYTSGTFSITGVGGGVTVSSNTGQRIDISVAAPVAQSVQTQNLVDVTLSGNTAGAMALVSSGTLTLAGGNNITLSQAGNAITISGAAAGGAQTAISGIAASNATYTSGTVTISGVGGGITVSSNTGQRIDLSVAAQSVQVVQSALAASNTTYTSGVALITGSNMVTVKSSGAGQTIIIDASQTVQTQGLMSLGATNTTYSSGLAVITGSNMITVKSSGAGQTIILDASQSVQTQNLHNMTISGNTSGVLAAISSGTLTLVGGNNITLSQAGNAITISGAAAGGAQTAISGIAASNTTYTSGSVTFSGVGGGVTVNSNTGQRVDISVAAPVAQTAQTGLSGVAASNATYTSGTFTITGVGGGVTVASNTGQRVDISVAAQSVQTQNLHNVTLGGNTAGVMAQISSGTLFLAGGPNITLSQNGQSVSISGGAGGGGGGVNIAASGSTYTSGTVEIDASDGFRSALNVVTNGQSVIITDQGPSLAYWARGPAGTVGTAAQNLANANLWVFPLKLEHGNRFDGSMTINNFGVYLSFSATATSISQALSSTMRVYLYTRNSDTLSMFNSGSMTFGNIAAATANSARWNGLKRIAISATSAWSANPELSYGGEYYVGLNFRTHVTSYDSVSWFNIQNNPAVSVRDHAGAVNLSRWRPGYALTSSVASATLAVTAMNAEQGASAGFDPYIVLVNSTEFTG